VVPGVAKGRDRNTNEIIRWKVILKIATSKNDTGRGNANRGAWWRARDEGQLCTVVVQMGAKTVFLLQREKCNSY
jgi:hypothetical protein